MDLKTAKRLAEESTVDHAGELKALLAKAKEHMAKAKAAYTEDSKEYKEAKQKYSDIHDQYVDMVHKAGDDDEQESQANVASSQAQVDAQNADTQSKLADADFNSKVAGHADDPKFALAALKAKTAQTNAAQQPVAEAKEIAKSVKTLAPRNPVALNMKPNQRHDSKKDYVRKPKHQKRDIE